MNLLRATMQNEFTNPPHCSQRRSRILPTLLLIALTSILIMKFQQAISVMAIAGSTVANTFQQYVAGVSADSTRPVLKFDQHGKFQIAVFEDLHTGEAEHLWWGPAADRATQRVMNTVLSLEKPHLAVLNGDLITGENTFLENSTDYIDLIVKPLVDHNLPWASAYGNHDLQYNLSTDAILQHENQYLLSLTQKMVHGNKSGVSNYYLPVYSSSSTSTDAPALILWFFDSRGGTAYQERDSNGNPIGVDGVVDDTVAEWLSTTDAALKQQYQRMIPSLAFVHIPVYASSRFQAEGVDAETEPGINDDNPLSPQGIKCSNETGENVCRYVGTDVPFMSSLVKTKGLMAVFSGHDHGDDWCAKWDSQLPNMTITGSGVHLCFGRHTGYGGYGSWTRGSRQIVLNEDTLQDLEVETWNRLEDGLTSGLVTLNSTYGADKYPKVPNTKTYLPEE